MSFRDTILAYAERQYPVYRQIALDIHARPETSNHEYFAYETLTKQLKAEGFEVKVDVAGHPTGFVGTCRGAKPGPTLCFLAEYDALAGLGHGCGPTGRERRQQYGNDGFSIHIISAYRLVMDFHSRRARLRRRQPDIVL